MKWPWTKPEPPAIRPQYAQQISEFEDERLSRTGVWLTIHIQVMPNGGWVNWKHEIPEELRNEAKNALVALAMYLQNGE